MSSGGVGMSPAVLEAARRLFRGVVAPAVVVALAVTLARHVGELVSERALALLLSVCGESHTLADRLQQSIRDEAVKVRLQRRRGYGQEAGQFVGARRVGDTLRAHPVHGLEHL